MPAGSLTFPGANFSTPYVGITPSPTPLVMLTTGTGDTIELAFAIPDAIPEPSSRAVLLLLGLVPLAMRRRRR